MLTQMKRYSVGAALVIAFVAAPLLAQEKKG